MNYNFTSVPKIFFGEGALKNAALELSGLGTKALIVTGKIITKTGLTQELQNFLSSLKIESVVFNDLPGEPDDKMIMSGVQVFKFENCDFIIGLGGGTPLDTAKAISAMSVLPGKMIDYKGKELNGNFAPLVLIPTTAGTGSEVTRYFVFTNTGTNEKLLYKGDSLLPKLAVIDYNYTISAPESITMATGMDALCHAVESYTCRKANPVTEMYCLDAVKRIFKYLPIACKDGSNKEARENMSFAAYEAGVAINGAPTTIIHGMSRPIGACFHVPHGISNAMLAVECLRAVLEGCYEKFAELAVTIGAAEKACDPKVGAKKFLEALEALTKELKVPTLREYGIDLQEFAAMEEKMAGDSVASGSPANCWKVLSKEEQIKIYDTLRVK
ncbi:Alcohol dehydrogenase, class IV [Treponema bryantii]|uniref:Alcohol dehydrogenase, class IV n=1 Tax=Treponema bryantii TaxID=163 RepID=A0A1H9CW18_9SPIR|nr:iron-containing alcohol dehydrogenase [Treponema bryantii]SEQ05412.1 Alcohol dehydrogenase, class IV [Treponema bryantii]